MSPIFDKIREPVSSLTHVGGAVLSFFGLILLVYQGIISGENTRLVAGSVFGLSMVLLYTSSGLYHWFNASDKVIRRLQKLDHTMIYVLIAGTYTPYCLLALDGSQKWLLLSGIWTLAIAGIIVKLLWFNAPRWLSTMFYLLMGWIAVFSVGDMSLSEEALFWTLAGGVAYSIGAVIYIIKKPDPWPKVFGFHEIWHIWVLMGTFSHFWAVFRHM